MNGLQMWNSICLRVASGFSGGFGWQCSAVSYLASCFFACGVRVEFPIKPFKIQQFANH